MPELSYDETLQRLGVAPEAAAGPSISALAPGTEEAAIRVGERIEELRRSLESLPAELRAQVEKACADADEKLLHAVSFGVSQEDMEESRFAAQLLVDYADVLRQAAIDPVAAVVPAIDYERLTSEFGNEHGPSPAPPILSDILQRLPGLLSTGRLRRTLDGAAAQAGFAPSLYEALLDAPETAAAWLGQRDGEPPFSDRPTLANALSVAVDSNAGMTKFVELISTTSLRDDEPAKSAVVKKLQQLPTLLRRRPDATQIAAILNWLGKQSVPWQQLLSGELENKEFAKLTALLQSCPEADVHAFLDAGVGTSGAARSIVDQVSSELSNPDRKRDPEFVALVEQLKTKDKDLLTWDEIQASDVVAAARDFPSDEQLMFYGFEARRAPFVVAAQAVRLAKQDAAKALEFQGKKEAARREKEAAMVLREEASNTERQAASEHALIRDKRIEAQNQQEQAGRAKEAARLEGNTALEAECAAQEKEHELQEASLSEQAQELYERLEECTEKSEKLQQRVEECTELEEEFAKQEAKFARRAQAWLDDSPPSPPHDGEALRMLDIWPVVGKLAGPNSLRAIQKDLDGQLRKMNDGLVGGKPTKPLTGKKLEAARSYLKFASQDAPLKFAETRELEERELDKKALISTRLCKKGLEWVVAQGGSVLSLLDGVDLEELLNYGELLEQKKARAVAKAAASSSSSGASSSAPPKPAVQKVITYSEIRHALRHWEELNAKGKVVFCRGGKRLDPAEVAALRRRFEAKNLELASDALSLVKILGRSESLWPLPGEWLKRFAARLESLASAPETTAASSAPATGGDLLLTSLMAELNSLGDLQAALAKSPTLRRFL